MYKIYHGDDCDSINGFNNGYYIDEEFKTKDEAEETAKELAEDLARCCNSEVELDDSGEFYFFTVTTGYYNSITGEKLTKEEYEKRNQHGGLDFIMFRYEYYAIEEA